MNTIDIAVIINSYNRFSLLKLCIEALTKWVPSSSFNNRIGIVIFDAGSTDGTIEWLQTEGKTMPIPNFLILPSAGEDTSFAAGLNKGVSYAIEQFSQLRYLLFYETDNQILSAHTLQLAETELASNEKLGACGFTVRKHNGSPAGVGLAFPSLLNFFVGKQLVQKLKLEQIPYQWITGISGAQFSYVDVVFTSPLLVKVKAWKESGGLDAQTFPFSDCDIDWAKRLRNLGWLMGVVKADDVIHDNMATKSDWSRTRAMQFHRGRLRYFKRYHPTSVYLVWPLPLMTRHLFEWLGAKITKDPVRKEQLSNQFKSLLKAAPKSYE